MKKILRMMLIFILAFCVMFTTVVGCVDNGDDNGGGSHIGDGDGDGDDDGDGDGDDDDGDGDDDDGDNEPILPVILDTKVLKEGVDSYDDEEVVDVPLSSDAFSFQKNTFTRGFVDFFNMENKVLIKIIISSAELKKLDSDYKHYSSFGSKSPIYRMCDVEIETPYLTYTYYQVGIRMKGNTSLRAFWDEGANEVGDMIHYKLSFQEKFTKKAYYKNPIDWTDKDEELAYREERTFLGLSKLDLKWNKNFDGTHIREVYTNQLFESAGVLAPRITASNVNLTIDGENHNFGVFSAYEPIDASFFEKRLIESEQGGDLYKNNYTKKGPANYTVHSMGNNNIGEEDEDIDYFPSYDIKTNKKTTDHSQLKNLITAIDHMGNNNKQANVDTFNQHIHMEYFSRFEAMSYFVGNPDDLRNNYNNHYVYFLKDSGKMIIIPYDYDRTLGVNKDWNPSGSGNVYVRPYDRYTALGREQENPIYLKAFVSGAENFTGTTFLEMYKAELTKLFTNPLLTSESFNSAYEIVRANYGSVSVPNYPNAGVVGIPFSNAPQTDLSGTHQNIDVNTYITLKLNTLQSNI